MKTQHMILAVVAAALFAVLPHATAQQSDDTGIPTNLPGVTTSIAPPSGFNPVTASDSELAAYGFPPRPDKNASPKDYANWENAMMAAKKRIFPELELTNRVHGPNLGAGKLANGITCPPNINSTSTCVGNAYWSGVVETTTATSYGPNSFTYVQADFVVPVANFEPGQYGKFQCLPNEYHSATWVGIDGYTGNGLNEVLQAGTEADAVCMNGATKGRYYAWFDWTCSGTGCPGEIVLPGVCGSTNPTDFPICQGDNIQVLVWSTTSSSGKVMIINYSTNEDVTFTLKAPKGIPLTGNSAEWVVERPPMNGNVYELTNYNWDYFSFSYATTMAGTAYYPGDPTSIFVIMLGGPNGMVPISDSEPLGVGNLWFVCLHQPTPCQ